MTELNKVEGLITRFVQGRYVNAPDSQAANGFGPTNDTVFFASDESNRPPRALPFPLLVRDARHPLVVFSEHLRAKLRSAAPFAAEEVVFHFDSLEHYYGTFGNGYDDFFELGPHRKSVQYFQLTPNYPHSLLDRLRADWTAPLPSTQMAFSSAICVTNLVLHNCDTLREVGAKMFAGSTKLLRMEISNCRNLHTIRSGFCNSAQALRQVNISGNTRLNRIEAGFCAMCPKLDSVGLDGLADLRWVMTKFLANCPRLRALDISSFENTVQIGSHFLAECRSLSEVTFPTTWRVEDIGACFMRISDAGAEGGPGKSEVFGLQVIKLTMPLIRRIGSHFICGHSLLTEFTAKIGAWLAEIGPMFLGENRRLETMRIEHSAIVDYVRFEKAVKNVMTPPRCIVGASLLENCPLIANITLHFDYVSEGVHLADHNDVSCVLKRASLNTSVKPRLVA